MPQAVNVCFLLFLTQLERVDQESPLALEEAAKAMRFYRWLPPGLPFFRLFFAREKAKWDKLTTEELAALPPPILAAGRVLFGHVVTFCPGASETWPELFGQGSFKRLMEWDGRLSFDQISLCFRSFPTRDVQKHYSEAWIDLAVDFVSSDRLLSSQSMYEFLYHVSNRGCAGRLIEPIKRQILRPERA